MTSADQTETQAFPTIPEADPSVASQAEASQVVSEETASSHAKPDGDHVPPPPQECEHERVVVDSVPEDPDATVVAEIEKLASEQSATASQVPEE
jgi:hypothetical protein